MTSQRLTLDAEFLDVVPWSLATKLVDVRTLVQYSYVRYGMDVIILDIPVLKETSRVDVVPLRIKSRDFCSSLIVADEGSIYPVAGLPTKEHQIKHKQQKTVPSTVVTVQEFCWVDFFHSPEDGDRGSPKPR